MTIHSSAIIHPTAIVSEGAEIGAETSVGAYSVIGENVRIGQKNRVLSHVVIDGITRIGDENTIYQFASVGAAPQDLKFHGEPSELHIGSRNILREYTTLQPGTEGGGMKTVVGNGNLFMACSHVGHDGIVGDKNIFANSATLAGHVEVGSGAIVGGLVGIHQFVRIGDLAMIGAGAMVSKDIPPYCTAQGDRAYLVGLNTIGLQRAGLPVEEVKLVKKAYRTIFMTYGTVQAGVEEVKQEAAASDHLQKFLDFIQSSERGVALARTKAKVQQE